MSSDTVQLSDQFLLASSLKSDPEIRVSKNKHVVYVSDGNQGSYQSGQIIIDATNQLNGSQGFASMPEQYLTVPYIVTAKAGATGMGGVLNRFGCTLKTGVFNIISDLELELNGKAILTTNEYKNFWNNLRSQTETSVGDLYKHGSDAYLQPDDWYSINFSDSSSVAGDGYSNNQVDTIAQLDSTLGQTQENRPINSGLVSKLNNFGIVVDQTTNNAFSWASLKKGAVPSIVQQSGKTCFIEASTAAANAIAGTWIFMLKIKLVDLHPIFKELGLLANPQLKLKFRVNSGTTVISGQKTVVALDAPTVNPGTSYSNISLVSTTMTSGNTCPIMISSGASGAPLASVFPTGSVAPLSFSFGPLQNAFTTTSTIAQYLPYTTTRLHIPFYDLVDPRSIISKPVKTVRYLDCFAQYFKQRAGLGVIDAQQNATFNFQLSASLKNVKYIAVVPFAETSSGHWATAAGTEQFQSPFDSAPWTCQPGSLVRNFQVQLGNKNVFAKNHEYDYESFLHEFSKLGSINGDMTREMNCGLIDFDKWTYAHRVMIADCSRISEKDVPTSIQVSGTNSCSQGSNYLILVVYERELEIDRLTGEVNRTD